MAGPGQVCRLSRRIGQHTSGAGPVGGGNPGTDTGRGVDRHPKVGDVMIADPAATRGQLQFVAAT
ncbi:Uncharacterised protein [Mycobacteroides abscessus subsp. abscessus]|nr:Uncharacterised protein [Mycobacteroides abscessus subsp. abscessus]